MCQIKWSHQTNFEKKDNIINYHNPESYIFSNYIKKDNSINYIKELAGHSELKTTLNYTRFGIEDLKRAILVIN